MRSRSLFRYYGPTAPTEVEQYERQWAEHVGVRYALAVNSGHERPPVRSRRSWRRAG